MTPIQAMQPLFKQVECGYRLVRHVEPPIAEQGKAQERLRALKMELVEVNQRREIIERLIAHYEFLCGVPF